MNDVPKPIRIQILQERIQKWRNTIFAAEADLRVAKRVGEDTKPIIEQMKLCEIAIAELEAMLKEVEAEGEG